MGLLNTSLELLHSELEPSFSMPWLNGQMSLKKICGHLLYASIWKGCSESPYKLFTGQEVPWTTSDFWVFSCPTYILYKHLQDGNNISKWKTRSWKGVYTGPSSCHSNNVPNPDTMHVSPKFHVIYDESFTTATGNIVPDHESYIEKLYQCTQWMHRDKFMDTPYLFESFWDGTSPNNPSLSQNNLRKRKAPSKDALYPHNTTSRGSTAAQPASDSDLYNNERYSINLADIPES